MSKCFTSLFEKYQEVKRDVRFSVTRNKIEIARRLVERHFYPDRFMPGSIDYIGEWDFPF